MPRLKLPNSHCWVSLVGNCRQWRPRARASEWNSSKAGIEPRVVIFGNFL